MFNYEFLKIDYLNYSSLLYYACEFHMLASDGATLTSFFIGFLFVFLLFIDGKAVPLDATAVSTDIVRDPSPASNVNVRVAWNLILNHQNMLMWVSGKMKLW